MDDGCLESRLCLGGLRCADRIAVGRHADQPDLQSRNMKVQRDRCRDGSVIGEVLLPGGLGDELPDRRWIGVARTSANPGRDPDTAVAVGLGQRGREGALDIGRAAGEVLSLAREVEILRALLRRAQGARDRMRILEDRSARQQCLMHERGQIDRRADDLPTHGLTRHQGDSQTRCEHDLPLPMPRCGCKRFHRTLPACASDLPLSEVVPRERMSLPGSATSGLRFSHDGRDRKMQRVDVAAAQ